MHQRASWRRVGLIVAILCATATAADKKEPTNGEPPLEYMLNIDGQDVAITAGQTVKTKVGDREVQLRLTPSPERILKLPGLSLRYPANYTYESDQSNKDAPQWTLHGRHAVVIFTRVKAVAVIQPAVEQTINDLTSQFGEKNVKRSEAQFNIAGKATKVAKIDFVVVSQKLRQYVFGLSAGGGTYLMILQETPNEDGSSDDETKDLINRLDKGLVTRQ
jgi:hypothetical protein